MFWKYVVWKFDDSSSFDQLIFQIEENYLLDFNVLETETVLLTCVVLWSQGVESTLTLVRYYIYDY